MLPCRSRPTARAMRMTCGKASRNSGDSLRLPGAETNGAITLQLRSQKATTLSPLIFLCPLKPMLSPPFLAAVVVPSPWMTRDIEQISLHEARHRAGENRIDAAMRPASRGTSDKCACSGFQDDHRRSCFDRQLLPLTTHIQQLQNVVEDRMQAQLRGRSTAPDDRCGKTNCVNCARLKCVGIHCQCLLFAISTAKAIGF